MTAMAYDESRSITVMFGGWQFGVGDLDDTWEWDGESWDKKDPSDPQGDGNPGARSDHRLFYDPARQRVVLWGGSGNSTPLSDGWEWDGESWRSLERADPDSDGDPVGRSGHGLAAISHLPALMLFGGAGTPGSPYLVIPWLGFWGDSARPGHVARFDFTQTAQCAEPTLLEIEARWVAGGHGETEAPAHRGAALYVWDRGRWNEVASNSSDMASPGLLEWSTSDFQVLDRLLYGDRQELILAATPSQPNGSGRAEVLSDYLEAVVTYRITADELEHCE